MDLFILKMIGIVTMFTDHWYHVIGGSEVLNIIGRTAFPIFAFSLGEGYVHTKNLKKYLLRLFLFAIIIHLMIFYMNYSLNIFFTLFTGLLIISLYHSKKINILPKIIIIGILCYISVKFDFDYGIYGILTIMIFHFFRQDKIKITISFLLLNIAAPFISDISKIQIYSMFGLIPIFLYNGKKGRNMKYFFYLFYPLHFLVLEGIKLLLKNGF